MAKNEDDASSEAVRALEIINNMRNEATAAVTAAVESQRLTAAAFADAQSRLAEITAASAQALVTATKVTDLQGIIATKSDHIQDAQNHADRVRADLDRLLTSASQVATDIESNKARAQTVVDVSAELLANLRSTKASADGDTAAIGVNKKTTDEAAASLKALSEKAETVDARVKEYESRLATLEKQSAAQLQEILTLLPGATSAGLAHSFDVRRQTFLKPHEDWQRMFGLSVTAIGLLAIGGLLQVLLSGHTPTNDELLRLWLARLPIAAALVWLALHASHEAALSKRVEEDYGFKSAVAASFLGFYRQLKDVGAASVDNPPLARLCSDTLATMAAPPGRIYDGQKLAVSPADEIKDLLLSWKNSPNIPKPTDLP